MVIVACMAECTTTKFEDVPSCPTDRRLTLPTPTTIFTRSSSCKRQKAKSPPGHVKRAPNPFILFRCDFVKQKFPIGAAERDHRNNVSCAAGRVWKGMTKEEKEPWVRIAERERAKYFKARKAKRANNTQVLGEQEQGTVVMTEEGASISTLSSTPSRCEIFSDIDGHLTNSSDGDTIGSGEPKDENKCLSVSRIIGHSSCSYSIDALTCEETTGMPSLDNVFVVETEMDIFSELEPTAAGYSDVDQEAFFLGYSPIPAGLFPADVTITTGERYSGGEFSFGEPPRDSEASAENRPLVEVEHPQGVRALDISAWLGTSAIKT